MNLSLIHFTWCVEFKARNNQKIKRQDYIDAICELLEEDKKKPSEEEPEKADEPVTLKDIDYSYNTDYKNADFDFVLEVFRDLMMFSIVKEYK